MINRIWLSLVVVLLLVGSARADCMSAEAWLAKVGESFAPAAVIIDHSDLADDLRSAAAGEFNSTPPIRDPIMPGRAIVVVAKSVRTGFPLPFVLIGFFVRGCAAGTLQVPIAVPATEADNG